MVHECVMCMCDVVETVQREVKRIQRRFLWWPTEERVREGGEQSRGEWSLFVCRLGRLDLDQRLRVKTSFEDVFLTWRFLPSAGLGSIPPSFGLIQLEFLYALKWQEHGAEMKAFRYRIVRIKMILFTKCRNKHPFFKDKRGKDGWVWAPQSFIMRGLIFWIQ